MSVQEAEQEVIRRAQLVASWGPHVYVASKAATAELEDLLNAVTLLEIEREKETW